MIKKVKITEVYKNDTNKNGDPYVYKKGKYEGQPFSRVGIKTDKTGDNVYYTNAMTNDKAMDIEVGQSLLLNLTEEPKEDGNGSWFNFNSPTKEQLADFAAEAAG